MSACWLGRRGGRFQCPYFAGCEYIQTRQAAYSAPLVILVHAHLGLEWGATAAERFESAPEPEEDEVAGVDRTANRCAPPCAAAADRVIGRPRRRSTHSPAWSGQRTAGPTNAPGDPLGNHCERAIMLAFIFEPIFTNDDGVGVSAPLAH